MHEPRGSTEVVLQLEGHATPCAVHLRVAHARAVALGAGATIDPTAEGEACVGVEASAGAGLSSWLHARTRGLHPGLPGLSRLRGYAGLRAGLRRYAGLPDGGARCSARLRRGIPSGWRRQWLLSQCRGSCE